MSDDKGKKVRCWEGVKVRETSNPDFVNHGRMCRFNVYPVLNTIKGPNLRRQGQDQVAPGRQPERLWLRRVDRSGGELLEWSVLCFE